MDSPHTELQSQHEAGIWRKKIEAANKYYEDWENRYECKYLEECYEGFQWKNEKAMGVDYKAYVVNLFFSSIEAKIPSLIFNTPVYTLRPRPYQGGFDQATEFAKCRLKEDTLNSFALKEENSFSEELEDIAYNAFFRFGVMEVGYSTDWMENPKAGLPLHEDDASEGLKVTNPTKLPVNERIYVQSIDPRCFRVGGRTNRHLDLCEWAGYYTYFLREELEANTSLDNLDKIDFKSRTPVYDTMDPEKTDLEKVWFIWDNRKKRKLMIHDRSGLVLKSTKFERLPLKVYGPIRQRTKRCVYPVPVAFAWISPQMEINETREAQRIHRRKFKRKFIIRRGAFEKESEIIDLIHGGDGAFAQSDYDPTTTMAPVPMAPMDPASRDAMMTSKDDFNIVSATSAEMRGEADRTTATQAQLIENRSSLRENHAREKYAKFLCKVGREVIIQHYEKMVNPFMVSRMADNGPLLSQVNPNAQYWEEVLPEELEGMNFDVEINVTSISPIANEEEKKKLFELLAVINQYPQLSISPLMLREVMDRIGYRNERVAMELQNMAMMQMFGVLQQMQGNMAQQNVEKSTPDTQAKIENQLQNQVGRV